MAPELFASSSNTRGESWIYLFWSEKKLCCRHHTRAVAQTHREENLAVQTQQKTEKRTKRKNFTPRERTQEEKKCARSLQTRKLEDSPSSSSLCFPQRDNTTHTKWPSSTRYLLNWLAKHSDNRLSTGSWGPELPSPTRRFTIAAGVSFMSGRWFAQGISQQHHSRSTKKLFCHMNSQTHNPMARQHHSLSVRLAPTSSSLTLSSVTILRVVAASLLMLLQSSHAFVLPTTRTTPFRRK